MNKALIAFWSNTDKKTGYKKWSERLIGIYATTDEAFFIRRKTKNNFEIQCDFKIEETSNPITHSNKNGIKNHIEFLSRRRLDA
tara:strand:- start:5469 stop:5720 length:252 start_codon:yes stop_codon:yes gene_type:complete